MATKCILVIDNEPSIQEVTQICLETVAGWDVLTASSGREGIEKAGHALPDAILLDVMMPDMDGLTTFQYLQADPAIRSIPVILLTAKLQAIDRRHYEELGLKAAIAKPFDPLQLAAQIAAILDWVI